MPWPPVSSGAVGMIGFVCINDNNCNDDDDDDDGDDDDIRPGLLSLVVLWDMIGFVCINNNNCNDDDDDDDDINDDNDESNRKISKNNEVNDANIMMGITISII